MMTRSESSTPSPPLPPLPERALASVVHASAVPWGELSGASLFLTGGTGFVGTWLLETLLAASAAHRLQLDVTVLTRDPQAFRQRSPQLATNPALQLMAGDVRESFEIPARCTHVIHGATAASAALTAAQPELMRETIVLGMRRILDAMAGTSARRLLFLSSGAVYGPQPPALAAVAEEPYPTGRGPVDAYAEGKRAAEQLCFELAAMGGVEIVIGRLFAFVGPHLPIDTHFAIGNFLRDAMAGETVRVGGDGTPWRSYLYAADMAAWLWTLLLRGRSGQAYNVGGVEAVTIAALAERVARVVGDGRWSVARAAVPGAPAARYVPDTSLIRAELGVEERTGLNEALRETAAWWRLAGR